MHIIHLAVTLLAAAGNGYAAWLNFAGADSVKAVAHEIGVSLLHRRLERSHPGA